MKKLILCYIFLFSLFQLVSVLSAQSLKINEFLASNLNYNLDEFGEDDDWIELYNSGAADINLAGYYLSDDLANPQKWQIPSGFGGQTVIPAQGFLILWADGQPQQGPLHLSFSLSKNGEQIGLFDSTAGVFIDSLSYGAMPVNVSGGRYPDGAGAGYFFDKPTPGAANGLPSGGLTASPQFSVSAGIFSAPLQVSLSVTDSLADIYYTTDASVPNQNARLYTGAITIDSTMVIRARAFHDGQLPSATITNRYFINPQHDLPLLSLVTDWDNLLDPDIGIHTNYKKDGPDWERDVNLQYFRENQPGFSVDAGIRLQGSTSRYMNKKSYRIFFRPAYGRDRLVYDLFGDPAVQSFNKLVLRSGYDDALTYNSSWTPTDGTLLRDPLASELWQELGQLNSRGNFAAVYLNERYWGIYNIRENVDEDLVRDHLGWQDFDMVRLDRQGIDLKFGTRDEWDRMWTLFQTGDFSQDSVYQQAAHMLDMDSFTDLQALVQFTRYYSWGWGVFAYRASSAGARWRWVIWDLDRTFDNDHVSWNGFSFYNSTTGQDWPNLMMKQLLKNARFRHLFINKIADLLNTHFRSGRAVFKLDSLKNLIESELPKEADRWHSTVQRWQSNVQNVRDFINQRPAIVRQQILSEFDLPAMHNLTVDTQPAAGGTIKINSANISAFPWSGIYFENNPITVTAQPAPGYRFAGWQDGLTGDSASVELNLTADTHLQAVFQREAGGAQLHLMAPRRGLLNEQLPVIVHVRDAEGQTDPLAVNAASLRMTGSDTDSLVQLKRGMGLLQIGFSSAGVKSVAAGYEQLDPASLTIEVAASRPAQDYSGSLGQGEITWDASSDRHITADLTVPAGSHLFIKKGTRVLLGDQVNVTVQGQLTIEGSVDDPVFFGPLLSGRPWGGVEFIGSTCEIDYAIFTAGGGDRSKGWAHMNLQPVLFAKSGSQLTLRNSAIVFCPGKALGADHSRLIAEHTVIGHVQHGGEYHYSLVDYDRCHVMNIPAAVRPPDSVYIDYDNDGMHIDYVYPDAGRPSRIKNSYFITGRDDAIDHNSTRLEVINCWLEDWTHEAVAASGGQYVRVFNTLARNCQQGYEAGHGSPQVYIDHSVAVENGTGLRFGDSYTSAATGKIVVTNSVFWGNKNNIRNYAKHLQGPLDGAIDISYSLTNDNYDGDDDYNSYPGCLTGEPQFDEYFYLTPDSPGAGRATNGSNMGRADSVVVRIGPVVINEIMYKAAPDADSKDWLELYNPQQVDQNLGQWQLLDSDGRPFVVPAGTIIPGRGYLVVARDTAAFKKIHSDFAHSLIGELPFGLGRGDRLYLYSAAGQLVDSVAYDVAAPWPAGADGSGSSLELIEPLTDNALAQNWRASQTAGGTPGMINSTTTGLSPNVRLLPERYSLDQNYPNPFNGRTTISFTISGTTRKQQVTLTLYNVLGQKVVTLLDEKRAPGRYQVSLAGERLSSGLYFYVLQAGPFRAARKLLLLK